MPDQTGTGSEMHQVNLTSDYSFVTHWLYECLLASGGLDYLDHATWIGSSSDLSPTLPSAALESGHRQNRALPYLKAQEPTTLDVVIRASLRLRRSNQRKRRPGLPEPVQLRIAGFKPQNELSVWPIFACPVSSDWTCYIFRDVCMHKRHNRCNMLHIISLS